MTMGKSDTSENRVKRECLNYLKVRRIKAWSNPSGAVKIRPGKFMSFGLKGSADLLGCLPDGRFLAVECKAPDGRLSPEQRQFLADIKDLGGLAIVAKSCRDIEAALMEAGYTGIVAGPLFEGGESGQNRHAPER
jgi:hypothetical protein